MNGKHFLLMAMVVFLGIGPSSAQNKVVVIPLMEKGCLAPVAVDSPSNWVYSNNGDSTVTDKVTGLVWQREDDNTQRKWNDAWNYCNGNDAELPGTGWRLPSADELMSIVDYGSTSSPAINGSAFPDTHSLAYWSASSAPVSDGAWCVYFHNGYVRYENIARPFYVRCVR